MNCAALRRIVPQALLGGFRPPRRIVHNRRQLRRGEHLRRVAGGQAPRQDRQGTGRLATSTSHPFHKTRNLSTLETGGNSLWKYNGIPFHAMMYYVFIGPAE